MEHIEIELKKQDKLKEKNLKKILKKKKKKKKQVYWQPENKRPVTKFES